MHIVTCNKRLVELTRAHSNLTRLRAVGAVTGAHNFELPIEFNSYVSKKIAKSVAHSALLLASISCGLFNDKKEKEFFQYIRARQKGRSNETICKKLIFPLRDICFDRRLLSKVKLGLSDM